MDEVFCCRGKDKCYLSRTVDQHGHVIDILRRDKRDCASVEALFRRTLRRTDIPPHTVISEYHPPYTKALAATVPPARHIRTGLHRAKGETTKRIERSHVATRDR